MNFRMILSEFLDYSGVGKKSITNLGDRKDVQPILKNILKDLDIKNAIIEQSNTHYFITLNNSSTSNNLTKLITNNYNITDITFDKGKLTIVILK